MVLPQHGSLRSRHIGFSFSVSYGTLVSARRLAHVQQDSSMTNVMIVEIMKWYSGVLHDIAGSGMSCRRINQSPASLI